MHPVVKIYTMAFIHPVIKSSYWIVKLTSKEVVVSLVWIKLSFWEEWKGSSGRRKLQCSSLWESIWNLINQCLLNTATLLHVGIFNLHDFNTENHRFPFHGKTFEYIKSTEKDIPGGYILWASVGPAPNRQRSMSCSAATAVAAPLQDCRLH